MESSRYPVPINGKAWLVNYEKCFTGVNSRPALTENESHYIAEIRHLSAPSSSYSYTISKCSHRGLWYI